MKILVTGITGYIGSLVAPRLVRDGHDVRGFSRVPDGAASPVPVVAGDAISGEGLREALDGIEVAYFLIHSMEPATDKWFASRERVSAENFAEAAAAAGVRRVVYLGGLVPNGGPQSAHLASRMAVETILKEAVPDSVALRASIVIGAHSRAFRFLVRLVERLPVMAVPAWRIHRTAPIDERDVIELLARSATDDAVGGQTFDVGGPDIVSYGELIDRIADVMLVQRPALRLKRMTVTPIASRLAALVAGEDHELIGPLMESLGTDLIPEDDGMAQLLHVRLHRLDSAIEHALADWEREEPLAAR